MTLSRSLPLVLKTDVTEIVINDWTVLHFTTPFITINSTEANPTHFLSVYIRLAPLLYRVWGLNTVRSRQSTRHYTAMYSHCIMRSTKHTFVLDKIIKTDKLCIHNENCIIKLNMHSNRYPFIFRIYTMRGGLH